MTEAGTWPGLGFDPAPGDPAAVDGLTTRLISASRALLGARDTVEAVRAPPGGWEGDAARAFTAKAGELPEQLGNAHTSLDKVSSELHEWQTTLEQLQAKARDLEARAMAARQRTADASVAAEAARSAPDLALVGRHFDTDTELDEAQNRLNSALAAVNDADRRLDAAQSTLEQLISDGQRLLTEHRSGADSVAAAIVGATDGLAPPEPGWLEEAGDWCDENVGTVGDAAGVVSAVAGSLALIPLLTPFMGPLALVSGAVALVAHGVDIGEKGSWGDFGSWVTLGGDALGMVPVVGALGKAADAGAEAAALGGGLLTRAGGVTELASTPMSRGVKEFGRVFSAEAFKSDAAPVFEHLGEFTADRWVGNAQLIGKLEQGVVGVGLQAPTVDGWVHPCGEGEYFKGAAGLGGALVNGAQIAQENPMNHLRAGLGRFARAVR